MKDLWAKVWAGIKSPWDNAPADAPSDDKYREQSYEENRPPRPTAEEARKAFRTSLTDCVAGGWTLEIENEYDAVLSKKSTFHWGGKLLIFLLLLFVFAPLALFYLIVVIVRGVSAKPSRLRVWIDEDGLIQKRQQY